MSIPHVHSAADLTEFLECDALVLYFTAAWCGPCQAIAPLVEQLYAQYTTVEVAKVDLDEHRDIAAGYSITAVPTFVFIHNQKEVDRIRGASTQKLHESLKNLSVLAPQGRRRGPSKPVSSQEIELESRFVSKGLTILNSSVLMSEFEALNVSQGLEQVKKVVELDSDVHITSDADSQLLIHVSFKNVCKVSSVLIRSTTGQTPNVCKIWANRASILSFDDVSSVTPLHEEEITEFTDGWYEIKVKYVRFQKVTSLDLFLDGEDEDEPTTLDKIVVVGVDGECKTQAKLEKPDDM